MRFDARAAKLLAAGAHMTIEGCPGLRLEATESRRSWVYRYKSPIDGRMRQVKIGQWPAMSPAAAAVEWENLREQRDAGRDPATERRAARSLISAANGSMVPQGGHYTVRQLCEDYLVGHVERHRKLKGAREVRRTFDTMLGDFGKLVAATVTRTQAFDLLESHADTPVQAAKLRGELGAAWDYGLDSGRLPDTTSNWWRQIMRGRLRSQGKRIDGEKTGVVKRVLSDEEVGELIRWLPNFSRNVADALTLYLWTGARGAEIMAMEGREVAEEADGIWWTLPKAKTKNARHAEATDLRVPLVGRAQEVVLRRKAIHGAGHLFPATRGKYMEQKVVQTAVHFHQPYSKTRPTSNRPRLTVTHWAPHDLRRTVRTMLAAMGCPELVAEAVLGHMVSGVRGVYNRHAYDAERRQWLSAVSDRLEQLAASWPARG